jgi:hypothetical protein
MTGAAAADAVSHPRWDGRRMLFEVLDADRAVPCVVPCAISLDALQDLSPKRRFGRSDLLGCFAASRERIGRIALRKLHARAAGMTGVLNIWSDDIDEPPPASAPLAAVVPRAQHLA